MQRGTRHAGPPRFRGNAAALQRAAWRHQLTSMLNFEQIITPVIGTVRRWMPKAARTGTMANQAAVATTSRCASVRYV